MSMDNGGGKSKKRTEDGHTGEKNAKLREGLLRLIAVLLSEHARDSK
jgi:hypothetical protein